MRSVHGEISVLKPPTLWAPQPPVPDNDNNDNNRIIHSKDLLIVMFQCFMFKKRCWVGWVNEVLTKDKSPEG